MVFSEEQITKRLMAKEFAMQQLNDSEVLKLDKKERFNVLWKRCADFGLFSLAVPQEYDGMEEDILSIVAIMEGLGMGVDATNILFSANVHIFAGMLPILEYGSKHNKDSFIPGMMEGDIICAHAISEENAGSDIWSLETTYEEVEGGYRLSGIKNYVTNAPYADLYIVYARKKESKKFRGVSAFLVQKGTEGFEVGKSIDKMGIELSPMGSIYFNDCVISREMMLGKEGQGMNIFNSTMEYERPFLLSYQVGIMERQLERCIKFAKERKQFKKRILDFQSISNRIADMKVRLEASRLLMYKVAEEKLNNQNIYLSSSIAKLYISESLVQNSMNAMEVYGACGYIKEYHVEEALRDSIGSKIYSGTSDIQRNIISSMIE